MHLLECNEDVLRIILDYLSRADLHALCIAHPCLGSLAEPLLYSAIEFTFRERKPHQSHTPPIGVTLLVGNLLRRPERAAYVRTISCTKGDPPRTGWHGKVPKIPVHESDLHEALSFVGNTRLSYRDTWMDELRNGTLDAYLAVLLSQLPRLRHLHLGPVFFVESDLIGLVLRSILCDSHLGQLMPGVGTSLHQLQTVTLERDRGREKDIRKIRNTENVLPFFHLPSLREMSVSVDDPLVPVVPRPTTQPPSALGLVSLRLTKIRESHLGHLLSAAPRLRSLHWWWYFDPDFEDRFNTPVVNLDQFMPALAHVRDTLTELSIPAYCAYANWVAIPFPMRVQGSLKALAGFEQLKRLLIPLMFFTGFSLPVREKLGNCLPRNLEELTLTDDLSTDNDLNEEWHLEATHTHAIGTWLEDVETSTPRLRKLCLVLQNPDIYVGFDIIDARNKIRELTRRAGIELKVEEVYNMEFEGWELS